MKFPSGFWIVNVLEPESELPRAQVGMSDLLLGEMRSDLAGVNFQ